MTMTNYVKRKNRKTINTLSDLSKLPENRWEWIIISNDYKLSEEFMDTHFFDLNWVFISSEQRLSEKLIVKHRDIVHWAGLSDNRWLDEQTVRALSSKFHHYSFNMYQSQLLNVFPCVIARMIVHCMFEKRTHWVLDS